MVGLNSHLGDAGETIREAIEDAVRTATAARHDRTHCYHTDNDKSALQTDTRE